MLSFLVNLNSVKVVPIILLIRILYGCENDVAKINQLTNQKIYPIKNAKDVSLIYSENANVKVNVTAPLMEEYNSGRHYIEMKEGIKVQFFDSLLQVISTLTANYAIHQVDNKIMIAKNDVVIINNKGEKLNTEKLIWNQDSAKIFTDEFVKITTNDEIIMGQGLEANQDFTKWKINNIKGTIMLNEKDTIIK